MAGRWRDARRPIATTSQFGLLAILVLLPLEMLSVGSTPRESMPELVQDVMLVAPKTHFVTLAQAILFRGAGFDIVWPQFVALALIGAALFAYTLARFRSTIGTMARGARAGVSARDGRMSVAIQG